MKRLPKNTRVLLTLAAFVGLMIGLAYASVPLYYMFCRATGFGGTTQRVIAAPAQVKDRTIEVSFDGNVDPSLPWEFAPDVRSVRVRLGEETTVKYHVRNLGSKAVVGTATYNVQPDKAGAYFDKIQCFCFTKQVLKPGEAAELTVQFYIDPSMADDHRNDDVKNITLSYTFFLSKDQTKARTLKQAQAPIPEPTSNPREFP